MDQAPATKLLAFDHGAKAIGVARADQTDRFATPLTTLQNDGQLVDRLRALVEQHHPAALVVGWPRDLNGQSTAQTKAAEQFAKQLERWFQLPVHLQDEAVTSELAYQQLPTKLPAAQREQRVHAQAAKLILEDYLATRT